MQDLIALAIGIVAGNITGLIGASGVMVVVPAFIFLGYSPSASIGASLFIDMIASAIVSWTYYQHKNLVIREGIWIALGSIVGAQIGSLFSSTIPDVGLGNSFSVFLIVSALILWFKGERTVVVGDKNVSKFPLVRKILDGVQKRPQVSGVILGVFVGIVSGLFGAGGGVLILLILIFVMRFNMHEGIGTSTLIMAITAASGAIGHLISHDLPLRIALVGSVGTIIGGRLAAKYANKVNERILSKMAAAVFGLLSVFLLIINRKK
ncbi:MAG TPA: sulfite exporter TauE/SafE family protein [Spirochaetia bacterium]|jgi:uncharacterized membrane protein YfcA|nr:sulfite exporter TauE/SafE family protein [Spirochaetia bacterium]